MKGLSVGHYTHLDHGTGVTVFLLDKPAVGVYHLCGSSPATREVHALELEANVTHIDGLVLTGGSALGLGAVDGAMHWFKERGRGYPTHYGVVPIIPTAAIYDLSEKTNLPPTVEETYQACVDAIENNPAQGQVGAGTGASVGKLIPHATRMPGGFGYAEITLQDGVSVIAYAVVNSVGDVRDKSGHIVAGGRLPNGEFASCEAFLLSGETPTIDLPSNTTLVAVFTNANFSKAELKRIAKMSVAGMARAIAPVFSSYDGDLIFCVSLGKQRASELVVGTMAAEAIRQAIVNAVTQ